MKKEFKSDSHGEAWRGGRIRGCLLDTEHLGSFRFLTWGWKSTGPRTCGWAVVAFSGGDWGIVPNGSRSQSTRPAVKGSEAMVSSGRSFRLRLVVKADGIPPGLMRPQPRGELPPWFQQSCSLSMDMFSQWLEDANELTASSSLAMLLANKNFYYYILSLLIPDVLHLKFYWVWYQYGYHRLLLVGTCLF